MTQSSDLQPWILHFAPHPTCVQVSCQTLPSWRICQIWQKQLAKNYYIFIQMPLSKSHWCCSCRQKKKQQQWLYASILGVEGKERIKPNVNFMIVSTMKLPSWPNSFVCMRSSMGQWSNDCGWWLIFWRVIQQQDAQDIHHIIVSQVLNPKYNFQIDHKLNYEHKHHTLHCQVCRAQQILVIGKTSCTHVYFLYF